MAPLLQRSPGPRQRARSLLLAALVLSGQLSAHAQLSAPISDDGHISVDENKFLQNGADMDAPGARCDVCRVAIFGCLQILASDTSAPPRSCFVQWQRRKGVTRQLSAERRTQVDGGSHVQRVCHASDH